MNDKWSAIQLLLGLPVTGEPDTETASAVLAQLVAFASPVTRASGLTVRGLAELIGHEAIVFEAYKDSVGVWTWGIGVTNASGHTVYPRYKDDPQPLSHVLEIFIWLAETRYLPAVKRAFAGYPLSEAQLHAALSFHYNTGAITSASWVKSVLAGEMDRAREQIMSWKKPPEIVPRRAKERDLFFDDVWSGDGTALAVPVSKPGYTPNFRQARRVNVVDALRSVV